ncbi:MAG TPA: DUF4230 domain-containing protein [Spirochaetia bacterium]|nr:DUF4230 domain-containing protein [Spirochaetia bacterium]
MKLFTGVTALLLLAACSNQPREAGLASAELSVGRLLSTPTFEEVFHKVISVQGNGRVALLSADYDVSAGVDPLAVRIVSPSPGRAVVYLPPAKILSIAPTNRPVHQYFVAFRNSWLVGPSIESSDRQELVQAQSSIAGQAAAEGILDKARSAAESLVETALRAQGFASVVFVTPPPAAGETRP